MANCSSEKDSGWIHKILRDSHGSALLCLFLLIKTNNSYPCLFVDLFKSCINRLEDVTDATSGFHTTETYTSKLLKIISSKSPGSNRYVSTLAQIQKVNQGT